MRVRPRFLPVCLVPFLAAACVAGGPSPDQEELGRTQAALGGIEGTFEYALDAPWRLEPTTDSTGRLSWGQIPIQISIHDAQEIFRDSRRLEPIDSGIGGYDPTGGGGLGQPRFRWVDTNRKLGKFCEVSVAQTSGSFAPIQSKYSFERLEEVEATTGAWQMSSVSMPHAVCHPGISNCAALQDVSNTSEWHATVWHPILGTPTPGSDLPLRLTAKLTRDPAGSCASTNPADFIQLTNHVRVHLGEAPLPRFDNGWLYGDLHYHSQGTDNEGEAGYNYRGVLRAMGALGVDFALASDHASYSNQVLDLDWDQDLPIPYTDYAAVTTLSSSGTALRDMSPSRFKYLHGELWKTGGANGSIALDGPGSARPQGVLSHQVVPQVFLGGEVDAIPEMGPAFTGLQYTFGNQQIFDIGHGCDGHKDEAFNVAACDKNKLLENIGGAFLFKDSQGLVDFGYSRAHLVWIPRNGTDPNAFVASHTGKYGGGGRRLTQPFNGREGVLPEIARKGYAFVAHPVPLGGCSTPVPGMGGGPGPDGPPWTDTMLNQAFGSPAVIGLEFWNEDVRLCTSVGQGDSKEIGYDGSKLEGVRRDEPSGFQTGVFELKPWHAQASGGYQHVSTGVEWMLHNGATQWDKLLRDGIDPSLTSTLSWLPANEPRRMFIGGGSDAHGDFNFRREGYMLGTSSVTDNAIAKVRNLLNVGAPSLSLVATTPGLTLPATTIGTTTTTTTTSGTLVTATDLALDPGFTKTPAPTPHTQTQIADTLAAGNFSVTDGPALRIVVDKNRNGVIDAGDTPMGEIVELYGEDTLPLLVQWKSTAEFGGVTDVQLYVGAQSGAGVDDRGARTYAIAAHGPRSGGIPGSEVTSSYASNGRTYSRMADGYWKDPTGLLHIAIDGGSLEGTRRIELPLAAFQAKQGVAGERFYVRAFAETTMKDQAACLGNPVAAHAGACIRRYAFTNPIWAMTMPRPGNVCPSGRPRAMDRDGDGLPDGCDPCPTRTGALCGTLDPVLSFR